MSSKIQDKLFDYEVQPPEKVWNRLSEALNHQSNSFKDRLYTFEQLPPQSVWSVIDAQLISENNNLQVLPFYKKYSRPLKYSGVAAALIFLAILSTLLISKKSVSEVPGFQTVNHKNVPDGRKNSNQSKALGALPNTDFEDASSRPTMGLPEKISLQLQISKSNSIPFIDRIAKNLVKRERFIPFNQPPEKYMVYSDGNGNAVRLPKKLFDVFACPQNNITCRQQLKKLQEKLALSSMTSDLTGLLEMLNNLQENQ